MKAKAQLRAFVDYKLNRGFEHSENLKNSIQERIGDETESNFLNVLNDISGDNKDNIGTPFDEVVLQAMAYFFAEIFPSKYQIKNSYWTLEIVKGFLDACNHSPYTPTYEVVTTCYPLRKKALFNHCWLIIQTAYFFNSIHFGRHQYLEYTGYYIRTGKKLPIDQYRHSKPDLLKQYDRIDEKRKKGTLPEGNPEYYFVTQWYNHILFLVVRELGLNDKNFTVTHKKFREFNPSIKTPTVLRYETPFITTLCDIKSAYPSFLDAITGGTIGRDIYARIMAEKKYTRPQAKRYFNMLLNSGQKDYWKEEKAKRDLIKWGYTESQANHIIRLTHDKETTFYEHMAEIEEETIQMFCHSNNIRNGIRLHDGVIYIDDKTKPHQKSFEHKKIILDVERPKQPVLNLYFGYSNKRLPYGYIGSVPALKLTTRTTAPKEATTLGKSDGFVFYAEKYEYFSAMFNLNEKYAEDEFIQNCRQMLSTIHYLNNRPVTVHELYLIVLHIRKNSNILFSERYLYNRLKKIKNEIEDVEVKTRDYELYEKRLFKKKIDFLNALNSARGKVNQICYLKTIRKKLIESIALDAFEWIDFELPKKRGKTLLHHVISDRINFLRTGRKQRFDAQMLKWHPLYNKYYKEDAKVKFEHKQANKIRLAQRRIQKYEKQLLQFIQLQKNRHLAKQYIHILNEILGIDKKTDIEPIQHLIEREKQYLIETLGIESFEELILIQKEEHLSEIRPTKEDFDTEMANSLFNHIDEEEAYHRGILDEYFRFHGMNPTELTDYEKKFYKQKYKVLGNAFFE